MRCTITIGSLVLLSLTPSRPARCEQVPEVVRLQRAALHAAGLDQGRYRNLRARQHLSALLPRVTTTLGQGMVLAYSTREPDSVAGGTAYTTDSDSGHQSFSISAAWDLTRLLYAKEELALLQHDQKAAQERATVATEVARLYFERRRLLAGPRGPQDQERIDLITATLDAMTGLRGLEQQEAPARPPEVE